jgi:hypothetical protein
MKQSIEIVGDFIQVTDSAGEIFVVPKNNFLDPYIMIRNDGIPTLVYNGGVYNHTTETLFEFAREYSIINEKWIICHGKLIDIKRVCESVGFYIENDEIIPEKILRKFSTNNAGDVLLNDQLVNNKIFIISVHEWIVPTKTYPIQRNQCSYSQISINGIEYHEDKIKRKLESYGYMQPGEHFMCGGNCVFVGKKIFSGGFLRKLMIDNTPTVQPKMIDAPVNDATIVGFRREGKCTVIYYSDNSIEINNNNESPEHDPKISSVCKNILMNFTDTHMIINCSGKIRKIAFDEIHFPGLNSDGTYIFILGNEEKITETIRIHFGAIEDNGIQKIKDLLFKRMPTMCR